MKALRALHERLHQRVHGWCCDHLPPALYDRAQQRWRTRFKRSLYLRLLAIFVVLALGLSGLFMLGSKQMITAGWRQVVQPLLSDYVDRLAAEIGSPPDIARARALTERLPIAIHIDGPVVNWQSHPLPQDPDLLPTRLSDSGTSGVGNASSTPPFRLRRDQDASTGGLPRDAQTRALLTRRTADGHRLRFGIGDLASSEQPRRLLWWTLSGLVLLLAFSFALVRHIFRPLDDIRAGALRYGQGRFDEPIPLRRRDELGDLAHHVNQMATSLGHMLEGQRGLLLAISHELRSPLTRARLNAEMVAEGPERDALLRDLGQMRDLISDLLESERLAGGAAALQTAPTDLNALVRTLVQAQFPEAAVTLDLDAGLSEIPLDAARVQLLLRNLIDNALRHSPVDRGTPAAIEIRTTARPDGGWHLCVRDHGSGVPDAAQLARLGEPFFRPDTARTRRAGGVGLGLYLCRLVAESHGGQLTLRNAAPGLEVCVECPGRAA